MTKKIKIVADDKIPFLKGVLEPFVNIVYLSGAKITAADVADADAIFTRTRTHCNEALLSQSAVKLIVTATIGYDHIDTAYCEAQDIRWVSAPGCNSSSVQQYIAAALLVLAKEKNLNLQDMTLGVIGVGNVGSKVAKAAAALGMRVLLNDPPRAEKEGAAQFTDLEQLLAQSDIMSCHTPLTKEGPYPTYHLSNVDFFDKMKEGAVYINSARGAVTDTSALKQAVQSKLSAYILDVWEGEPLLDLELLEKAFIGTPHIAGYSVDGKAKGTAVCVREFCRFFGLNVLTDWYPSALPAPPTSTLITIDCAGKTEQEALYDAVTHTYPIWEDTQRLKQNPAEFEAQRGSYWPRREFDAFTIQLKHPTEHIMNTLLSLGFKLNN
ncbi:MAG: 4-phosphoerythronate dehydrogenase [Bacteroidales bacterium]|nr:4-phosphoerythronate dehydrogenase [Bacteroidales bacterium]MCL2133307.1 4-phosphoerythronate dehydrogenase [Bacteroidales bacterium]